MGGLQPYALILTLALPAMAAGQDVPDPLRHFATCTGRLSALVEYQWRTDGPASDATAHQRDAMADLLAAVTPPEAATLAMALRIEAKVAHAALLAQAGFDHRARAQALRLIAHCTGLLLG